MTTNAHRLIPSTFSPLPSQTAITAVTVATTPSADVAAIGYAVAPDGTLPPQLGLDWPVLRLNGFEGKVGQSFVSPQASGPAIVIVGTGDGAQPRTISTLRDVVASFVRAESRAATLSFVPGDGFAVTAFELGSAVAEATVLTRYRFTALQSKPKHTALESLEIVADGATDEIAAGVAEGLVFARSGVIARDLANTPPGHLTATIFGDLAAQIGPDYGLEITLADKARLIELGCGGLLGVNAGSAEEPRMIVLHYVPESGPNPDSHIALVGKGIMFDSGGISLKPSDPMHLLMKMDMGGAAAVFGAMTALSELGCSSEVTAFLMCTDNMPSGTATMLGDVLTIRGGTTVEVKNTDAEGRLVMSDALVLASELKPTAIVDIATLTGAAMMALGGYRAPAFGNNQELVNRVLAAAEATDEPAWQFPLEKKYRSQLDSDIADIANLGGRLAGATTAALFLAEFVGDIPWAHLDIAGTMQTETDDSWRSKGATGYGARLLTRLIVDYPTN